MHIQITAERRKELASAVGVDEQYIYQCLTGRRNMNPAEAVRIETATDGELSRRMLCQGTFAQIWPDLAIEAKKPKKERANV